MAESDSADTRPEPERVDGEGSQPRQQATTNMAPQPPPKGHPQQPLPPPLASVKHAQRQSQPVYYPQPVPAGAPVPVAPGYYTYEPQVVSGGPAFPTISADPPFNEKWHRAKILLSTASVICCIVFFVVGLVAGSRLSGSSYGWGFAFFAQFGIGGAGALLALIWTVCEFLHICCTAQRRSIHPGAHVAFHLIIWLITVTAFVIGAIYAAYEWDYGYYANYYDDFVWYELKGIIPMANTLLAFTVLLFIIHFILFVRACIETNQINTFKKRVYVQVPLPMVQEYYAPAAPGVQDRRSSVPPTQQPVQEALHGYYAPTPSRPAAVH